MEHTETHEIHETPVFEKQKLSFWRKIGGGSLTVSILIHAIALALGVYIVVQVIPEPEEPPVDFLPKSGGGGAAGPPNPGQKVRVSAPSSANRIAARGAESAFSLPEPDASSDMNSLSALDGGAMSGGMGGSGFGGGRGDGQGLGVGDGMGIGIGGGAGIGNPFGVADAKATGLIGVLYDLKQDKDGKSLGTEDERKDNYAMRSVIKEFNDKNWDERVLQKFYRAKQELKQTRILMPRMRAAAAPQAFQCEKEVQPKRWVVVYRGNVTAPKTGSFRFVGAGDDALMVRFNRKVVFDHGYHKSNRDVSGKIEEGVTYPKLGNLSLAPGANFNVQAGKTYPIEILIAEIPGGNFGALLYMEEIGVEYQKTKEGVPILPIFRTTNDLPSSKTPIPAYDKNSPIWKTEAGSRISDI
ncbi:MAG: hypothetical protein QM627_02890 [Luteolibacter sp.]